MHEDLCKFIGEELLNLDGNGTVTSDEDLLVDGMIDSLGMIRLVSFIQDNYQYAVPAEDFIIENFQTVEAIVTYLERSLATE